MTPSTEPVALDPVHTCERCGQDHPGCTGHRKHRDDDGRLVPCGNRPMVGQRVCRMHGGSSPQAQGRARRRLAAAELEGEVGRLLEELELDAADVHPVEVILDAVRRAWAMVQVLGALVGGLQSTELWGPDHLGDARPHVATEMYRSWLETATSRSKLALDAGVEERRVRLAEAQGAELAGVLRSVFAGLLDALVAAGLDGTGVRAVFESQLPDLVRGAIAAAVGGEPASAGATHVIDVGSGSEADPG